jgi:ribosomal-protein-alanine N-acetyltransferase
MLHFQFTPFPVLTSSRLLFRKVTLDDIPEIIALRGNPEVMCFIPRPLVTNETEAIAHINANLEEIENNTALNWIVCLKDNPKAMGIVGFYRLKPEDYRAEIGYMLLPEYHGQGYISEAVERLIQYGFNDMQLNSIEAVIAPDNIPSQRVVLKNNFEQEAFFKEYEYYEGRFLDIQIYSLLKRNYLPTI